MISAPSCGRWKETGMATRHCRLVRHHRLHGPTRPGTARPPRREPPRGAGLPQPHRSGRQPAVHRAHPGRHRTRRTQGQPRHLRHAGKQAFLGTGSIDTILAGGEPKNSWSSSAAPPQPFVPHRPPKPPPAPPPRSCCWSCVAASSPPTTDAPRAGTRALTRRPTGPNTASSQHLTDPLPDPDAVCRADAAVGNAMTETAQLTGNRHQSMIHRSDHHADRSAQDGPRRAPRAA